MDSDRKKQKISLQLLASDHLLIIDRREWNLFSKRKKLVDFVLENFICIEFSEFKRRILSSSVGLLVPLFRESYDCVIEHEQPTHGALSLIVSSREITFLIEF